MDIIDLKHISVEDDRITVHFSQNRIISFIFYLHFILYVDIK